jgi:hypothetical protein
VVPVQSTEIIVRRLEQLGSAPRMTVYARSGHDAWTAAYSNRKLYT